MEKSGRSQASRAQARRNPKSGFLEKPWTRVLIKHTWPHMNQNPRYIPSPISFNQLSFPQFVGGECRTILKSEDAAEVGGRLHILSKVAYLFEQCKNWDKARSAYFAILSSIEEGEAIWTSSFGHYDLMCPAPVGDPRVDTRSDQKNAQSKNPTQEGLFLQGISKRGVYPATPPKGLDKK